VSVSDTARAESELLSLLASDHDLHITEFGLLRHQLEEVFLTIVEGGKHDSR
jgi:hypothetical protein